VRLQYPSGPFNQIRSKTRAGITASITFDFFKVSRFALPSILLDLFVGESFVSSVRGKKQSFSPALAFGLQGPSRQ
jgi:hypothetical protein